MKTITIIIDKTGKPSIEAHGFQGASCKAATKPIEDALGASDKHVVEKPELFMASAIDTSNLLNL